MTLNNVKFIMSSTAHYIEVPYARNSSTSTLSSAGLPSHTLRTRSLSDVHPTLTILDESVLDPGKLLNMPLQNCCRHTVSKSTTSSSSITVPTGVTMETKSNISYQEDSQESAEYRHSVLDDDPVLDPNKVHTAILSEHTTSHSTMENQQRSESSLSSGRFSPSARKTPDGQTDDPDDHSSLGGDENDEYMSHKHETDDDHDEYEAEVSDTNAEYTPSNSSTADGYLPSDSESDEEVSELLGNAISKTSTLSSRVVNVNEERYDDDDNNTEIDFIAAHESNGTTTKKARPKTAVHRTPPKDPKPKEHSSATKSVGCLRAKQSPSRMKSGPIKLQKGKCVKKEYPKTKYGGTKLKLQSPRDKKFLTNKVPKHKQPCPNRRSLQLRGSRINSPRDFRKSPYNNQPSRNKKTKRTFKTEIGDKFVNLVEDVVTQMSLLGDDDDNNDIDSSVCPTPTSKPQKKEKVNTKHRTEAKDSHKNSTREGSRSSPYQPLRSDNSNNKLLMEQLLKWKNDYMRGLSMYIEDQLKQFDRSNSMVWNTLSNEGIHKREKRTLVSSAKQGRLADPVRKPCHTCDKKPVNMMKLRSIWNRPGTAPKSGKVLPRLLVSSDKTPPLASELNKTRLRKEVRQRLKTLRLARNSIPILAANDIKLVCHAGQLIMVGEGSTSISILGHLLSEKTFVVLKMFKLPYAGGKTIEIMDQSVLAGHVNKTNASPKFYGLVALDPVESTAVGVHEVAMAFKFIGHTPSCAVTTLSTLCERAATSQMYRDPDADTRTSKLNAVTIMKDIVTAMNKVHYANVVMPGLDVCKVTSFPFAMSCNLAIYIH